MGDLPFCRCGHAPELHEHHRGGADCGACGAGVCPRYRRPRLSLRDVVWLARHFLAEMRRR